MTGWDTGHLWDDSSEIHWDLNLILYLSGTMDNTLEKKSSIWLSKSKFFLFRVVSYFSFLLIPVWIQKSVNMNQGVQCLVMLLYISFMMSQWFLLGKEIDHRFKIYFRVNSSIDRVVYRLFLGMSFFVLYFNLLSFLPNKWIYNSFWITWVVLGLFYSWPTRGKIIQESVTSNFTEYRYLDKFEKTLVMLTFLMFIFSVPELPTLVNIEALKLFFDPLEKFTQPFWNFLTVNYYPFKKYPTLFKLAWSMHFYAVGFGLFLLTFYAFLRYFVSRRLSLLGVFSLVSSWSVSKIMASNYSHTIATTYSLIWIWSLMWTTKSSTYRSGLFLGLVGYLGTIINPSFAPLVIFQLLLLYFVLLKEKTFWFKRQTLKYTSFGLILLIATALYEKDSFNTLHPIGLELGNQIVRMIDRKAFYTLSFFGLLLILLKRFMPTLKLIKSFKINIDKLDELLYCLVFLIGYVFIFDGDLFKSFALMWPIVFFSLIPIELLFQTITRLRSSRNMIYLIYILICLLDSHFEGRVKIFLRLFN